jgi:AbrB family looped-hinge helix DNA binding protein
MTSKGQITIPIDVRKALGLHTGSRVAFVPTGTGSYELVPATQTIKALRGAIASHHRALSLSEMDEAIGDGAMEGLRR